MKDENLYDEQDIHIYIYPMGGNYGEFSRLGNCRDMIGQARKEEYSHSNGENKHEERGCDAYYGRNGNPRRHGASPQGKQRGGSGKSCFDISVFTAKKFRIRDVRSRILATAFQISRTRERERELLPLRSFRRGKLDFNPFLYRFTLYDIS